MGRGSGAGAGRGGAGTGNKGPRLGTRFVDAKELSGVVMETSADSGVQRTRVETQKRLLLEGKQPGPVKVAVDGDGRQNIIDGRHRILAARELAAEGRPVKVQVKFVRGWSGKFLRQIREQERKAGGS